jgi:glutamate-1-semialdehyde 2,1-aminomutase
MTAEIVAARERSLEMVGRARKSVAGGESSYAELTPATELALRRAERVTMWDQDGNAYLDLSLGRGVLLLGYTPSDVIDGVREQLLERGSHFSLPHRLEVKVGEALRTLVPGVELIRFLASGTEAVMAATRVARAATGRDTIVKFEGAYHGWGDLTFASVRPTPEHSGPAEAPATVLETAGMPSALAGLLAVCPFNDADALERTLHERPGEVAAVIIEPVLTHCGVVPPDEGYLERVRALTSEAGAVLIFDETRTGFRLAAGGAQQFYGVLPDLCVLGDAFGGGFPVAAFGGSAELMGLVADGTVMLGGTHAGDPLALSGADKVMDRIRKDSDPDSPYPIDRDAMYAGGGLGPGERKIYPGPAPGTMYPTLFATGERLAQGLAEAIRASGLPCHEQGVGPMFSLYLGDAHAGGVRNYRDAHRAADAALYRAWQAEMQRRGVYVHPDPFEPIFVSTEHTDDDLDQACAACEEAAQAVAAQPRAAAASAR